MFQEWSDQYLIGIDAIDAQHRKFFDATHHLYDEILNARGETAVEGALDFLRNYAAGHFQAEEAFMQKHEYPLIEGHKELHALFLRRLDGLSDEYDVHRTPTQEVADQILEMTQDWLLDHIIDEDTHYAQHVKDSS